MCDGIQEITSDYEFYDPRALLPHLLARRCIDGEEFRSIDQIFRNMKFLLLVLILVFVNAAAAAQDRMPTIRSNVSVISIQDGDELRKNIWTLVPEAKPDVYEAQLTGGKPQRVTFITDVESISFMVHEGKKYDFIIQLGEQLCYTQIVGIKSVPAAVFDKKYQDTHRGKTFVEIPEVYELVNVAIAMTPIGIEDRNLVFKASEYYKRMREWFDPYAGHPLLVALDKELKRNPGRYFTLKMNGYALSSTTKARSFPVLSTIAQDSVETSPTRLSLTWPNSNRSATTRSSESFTSKTARRTTVRLLSIVILQTSRK